jgi:hypothetical protein
MRLTDAGLLGLGTSSPATLLDISVTGGMARIGGASGNNLVQAYTGASGLGMWAGGSTRFYSSANITFSTNATIGTGIPTGYVDAMTIDSSGRVGIGTTSPLAACVISDGANGVEISPGVSSSTISQITSYNRTSNAYSNFNFDAATTRFSISGSEKARIDSAGNVGIGTSSPGSLLHLADAGDITVGTTTGTKIGTATTQKIGFYNATPVVQPTAVADATDAASVITQLNDLLAKLRTLGIIAT